MGSFLEFNDTLQITREQGFPDELNLETHLKSPYQIEDFQSKVFTFHDKPDIRIYHSPPVRVFFVENVDGKWIYWGLVHILEITHDYKKRTTSGKYQLVKINTPEEMKSAHDLLDTREEKRYFK